MSAHYWLVTVWSQSGSSREGKAECHCPVGVVMIWKIKSSPGPSFSGNIPGKQVNKSNWHIPGEQVKLGFSQHISCQTLQFQVKLVMVFAYRIHALHKHACWNAKKRVHEHAHRNARTHFFLHQTLQLLLVHTQCFLHRAKRQLQSMVRSADSRNLADVIFIAPARRASMA